MVVKFVSYSYRLQKEISLWWRCDDDHSLSQLLLDLFFDQRESGTRMMPLTTRYLCDSEGMDLSIPSKRMSLSSCSKPAAAGLFVEVNSWNAEASVAAIGRP